MRIRISLFVATVTAAALGALMPSAPAFAQTPSPLESQPGADVAAHPQDQIVLSGRVIVPRGQTIGEVVVLSGRVQIAGVAQGDVVVVNGSILISGQVSGTVISFDGPVRLAATAQVGGDVIGRGEVEVAEGAQVVGVIRTDTAFTFTAPGRVLGRFAGWLAVSVSTLLLGLLLLWLVPRGSERVLAAAREAPWDSAVWGVVVSVLLPVLGVLAVLSLVGLPLGVVLLLALAFLVFVAATWSIWILGRTVIRDGGRVVAFLAGWVIARVIGLIPVVSGATFALAAVFGIGAMTVALWRARSVRRRRGGSHRRGYAGDGGTPTVERAPTIVEPIA